MSSKKIIIGIVVFIILAAGLVVGLFLVRQQQELRKKAAPATTVSILPSASTARPGETVTLTVEMDAGTNTPTAADLQITFDSDKLSLQSLTPLDVYLPTVLVPTKIDNNTGSATITLGARPADLPEGKGTLATLKFLAKAAGSARVEFGSKTRAAGVKEATDLIVSRNSATITILAAPTPSPTPTPTSALTPITTTTPTPTPTTSAGAGGATISTPTPTPTKVSTTATPAAQVTTTPQVQPVAGVSLPTVALLFTGALVILLGVLLLAV